MGRFMPREDPTRSEKLVNHLATCTATKHDGWQPDGAWAVPMTSQSIPRHPGLGTPSGVVDHPAQVRSSNTTIRLGSRTQ
jgi:hypothetical protein